MLGFTICSNNYFAYATVLAKSWVATYPQNKFVIILVDELSSIIDYNIHTLVEVIPLRELQIAQLPELVSKYNIVELNTAIKPDAFLYLYDRYSPDKILYLDPDTKIFSPLEEIEEQLNTYDIIVTPHFITPIDDAYATTDYKMIGSGLFNLGFIGLGSFNKTEAFLIWWRDRLYKYCYFDLSRNMFYDQVWCNYIVVFFENYLISKHLGYNVANWNFHERSISNDKEVYLINNTFPLRFFHFSGYKHTQPHLISRYHDRYSFSTRPDMVEIYTEYQRELLDAGANELSNVPCVYYEEHKKLKAELEKKSWNELPLKSKIIKRLLMIGRSFAYGG